MKNNQRLNKSLIEEEKKGGNEEIEEDNEELDDGSIEDYKIINRLSSNDLSHSKNVVAELVKSNHSSQKKDSPSSMQSKGDNQE